MNPSIRMNYVSEKAKKIFESLLSYALIPPYLSSNDDNYTSCADTRYDCGKINNIDFPFWGGNRPKHCGHPLLQLNCDRSSSKWNWRLFKPVV
ncbi:hypothetical protein HN51_005547, partial [Arachis hypogaea]